MIAVIIVNSLITYSTILYTIDSNRITLRHSNPTPGGATHNDTSEEICSSRGHHKWNDDLYRQLSDKADEMPSFAVVLTVNDGFWDFFLNWLHHFNKLLASKTESEQPMLIVIAEDSIIYEKLKSSLALEMRSTIILTGYDEADNSTVFIAENYDSVAYKRLVSSRATHLLNLMCSLGWLGVNGYAEDKESTKAKSKTEGIIIVYSDVDTVWVKDPFFYLLSHMFRTNKTSNAVNTITQQEPNYDILAAVDDHNYNDVRDYYCTGILVISQTGVSISFLNYWEKELQSTPQLNQPIFNSLLRSTTLPVIRHGGLGEIEFAPGRLYFDEWVKRGDLLERQMKNETMVIHNNYIIGHDAKKRRFQEHGLWIANASQIYH